VAQFGHDRFIRRSGRLPKTHSLIFPAYWSNLMRSMWKVTAAAVALTAGASFVNAPASADSFGMSFGSRGVIGFSYQSGGYCDRWGCPGEFWNYPVYYCPVFYDGFWFRGPVYYRFWYGQPYYWVHGGWHEDEWDGSRPYWACSDRFGPPLDYDYYEENGFIWQDAWIYDWWGANRDFYPGYDFYWWRHHHRDWDHDHDFHNWRERHVEGSGWFQQHGFDRDWQNRANHSGANWQRGWTPNPAWTRSNPDVGNMRGFHSSQGNGPHNGNNQRGWMGDHGDNGRHDHGRPHDDFAPQENGPPGGHHDWNDSGGWDNRHVHERDNAGPNGNGPNGPNGNGPGGSGPNGNGPNGSGPNGNGPNGGPNGNGPFGGHDWGQDRHVRGDGQNGPGGGNGNPGGGGGPDNQHGKPENHQGSGPPPPPPPPPPPASSPPAQGGDNGPHEHGRGNGGEGNGNGGGQGDSGDRGDRHHGGPPN
jgi:hypothetical protein